MFDKPKPKKQDNDTGAAATPQLPAPKKNSAAKALIALLCAIAVFVALVAAERNAVALPPTQMVVAATGDVPDNLILTTDNIAQYFALVEINQSAKPALSYADPDELVGLVTTTAFSRGEIATQSRFADATAAVVPDAVEVSVAATNSSYANGGRIRTGDLVSIGYIDTGDGSSQYVEILSGIYVIAAMDSSGNRAVSAGDGVVATLFSLSMSKADAAALYSHVELGNVVVQKIC